MKLAIIVPLPDLTRFGYGRIATECIGSMARIADMVYLVPSTRNTDGLDAAIGQNWANVEHCGSQETYFARTPEGEEWFDAYKVMENCNLGMEEAREDGYDVAACLMCNQYIPEAGEFYQHCYRMLENGWECEPVYRMDQLGDQLFHASVQVPFIINLRQWKSGVRWATDSLVFPEPNCREPLILRMERGNYATLDAISVVDVQLEVERWELTDKQNYIRCYHDILPKRKRTFEWDYWFPYYVDKFRQKTKAGQVTDSVGVAIAAKSEPGFVSQQVLAAL